MESALTATALMGAFAAGIGTSLTPCVYPLIPVTLAIFGAGTHCHSKLRAVGLGAAYVFGIALTFTLLGVVSAQTGAVFGSFLGHPIVVFALCAFLVLMALFTLEIIHLPFVSRVQQSACKIGGGGYWGSFLMGTASGPVAAPCVGPVLVTYLTLAAESQNVTWGALLLFSYSLGFGLLFFVLALFPSLTKRLPKPGHWMNYVKFTIAAALLLVALFLAQPFLREIFHWLHGYPAWPFSMAVLLVTAIITARLGYGSHYRPLRLVGALCFALAVSSAFVKVPDATEGGAVPLNAIEWIDDFDSALARAAAEGKPVMVDLFAEWCAACKELDAKTFPDPRVRAKLKALVTARLDFTLMDEKADAISSRYKVIGLPTILFLNPDGSEIPQTRVTGFLEPQDFSIHLDRVLKTPR